MSKLCTTMRDMPIGAAPIFIPGVQDGRFDWYFLTNNEEVKHRDNIEVANI